MNDVPRRGNDRVPPGQYVTKKWPVLSCGDTPEVDTAAFGLRLFGRVEAEHTFDWQALQALPRREVVADFHCVTRFSTLDNPWSGFSSRDVLAAVQPAADATHAMLHCYGGYTTNLPLADLLSEYALFADRHGEEPLVKRLVRSRAGPWRSAAPRRAPSLRLEEREVGLGRRVPARRRARLLGGERLPHLRRPVGGATVLVAGNSAGLAGAPGRAGLRIRARRFAASSLMRQTRARRPAPRSTHPETGLERRESLQQSSRLSRFPGAPRGSRGCGPGRPRS